MSLESKIYNLNIILHRWNDYFVYKADFARALIRNRFKPTVILTYPEKPHSWHQLSIICHHQGYMMTSDPKAHWDIAIAFEDTTVRKDNPVLRDLSLHRTIINARCGDISKAHLNKVFYEVFGYEMEIDPRIYQGAYVRKSDANARHDGTVLHAPSNPVEGYVYQRLINNQFDTNNVLDIRVGVCKNEISFILLKYRTIPDRFDDTRTIQMVSPDEVFSTQEQADIMRFCKTFGLDYGELDILRDRDNGKIYIVDVNNTPATPDRGIQMTTKAHALLIDKLSLSFASAFLEEKK